MENEQITILKRGLAYLFGSIQRRDEISLAVMKQLGQRIGDLEGLATDQLPALGEVFQVSARATKDAISKIESYHEQMQLAYGRIIEELGGGIGPEAAEGE